MSSRVIVEGKTARRKFLAIRVSPPCLTRRFIHLILMLSVILLCVLRHKYFHTVEMAVESPTGKISALTLGDVPAKASSFALTEDSLCINRPSDGVLYAPDIVVFLSHCV